MLQSNLTQLQIKIDATNAKELSGRETSIDEIDDFMGVLNNKQRLIASMNIIVKGRASDLVHENGPRLHLQLSR